MKVNPEKHAKTARVRRLCGPLAGLCVLLLSGSVCRSETNTVRFSLDDCIEIGLANSAATLNAGRDEKIAASWRRQARAEALPTLGVTASYTRLDDVEEFPLGETTVEAGTLDNYLVEASVSQLLYAGGRVNAALRAARLGRDLAHWQRREVERRLVRDIRVRFQSILLAREAVAVYGESIRQLDAQAREIATKAEKGTAAEFDAISAKVALANERPLLIRARNAYKLAVEDLKRLIGVASDDFQVEGELARVDVDGTLGGFQDTAQSSRALLKLAATEVSLRREDVVATRSGMLPSLRAIFAYNGANSYRFVTFDDEWEWHWNAILALEWNIWDGGLTLSRTAEKKLELEKADTDLEEAGRVVDLAVRSAFLDLEAAEEALEAAAGTVSLAEKALSIARSRFDSGLSTRLELTEATLAVSRAKLSRQQALHDHAVATAELEFAMGTDVLAAGRDHDGKGE